MSRSYARFGGAAAAASPAPEAVIPGKRTLTDALPVQLRATAPGASAEEAPAIAARGVAGPGGALPFGDTIAQSFGPAHAGTVRGIEAHTGGVASAAAEDLGASAYATGNAVAFGGAPDLHTAAHEAAHVVQQRQGVSLKGGVGAAGDVYERHADAVADRVVAGESAADLLGGAVSAASSAPAVQRKDAPHGGGHGKTPDTFEADGPMVVYALAGVFAGSRAQMDYMPSKYRDAMLKLDHVLNGVGPSGHQQPLEGRERRVQFDEAYAVFQPFAAANDHFGGPDDNLAASLARLRTRVIAGEASARVDASMVIDDGGKQKAIEVPDDRHPKEQAEVLHAQLPRLISTMHSTVDRAHTLGDAVLKSEHGKAAMEKLEKLGHVLTIAEGWLKLNDEEFQHELGNIKGVFNGVSTISELVKTVLEMTSAGLSLTLDLCGLLAKAVGDEALEHACEEVGKQVGKGFEKVVAVIGVVHGIATMLDSSKGVDARIDGAVEAAAGVAVLATGTSLAALPIVGPYMLIKGAQYLYSEAVEGWDTDLVRGSFQAMQQHAVLQGRAMEHLAAAQLLQAEEKDPERRAALATEEQQRLQALRGEVLSFLRDTEHRDHGSDIYAPGNLQIISDAFAGPRRHMEGARTKEEVIALAHEVTAQVKWCYTHGAGIIKATMRNQSIVEAQGYQDEFDEQARKKAKEGKGE